MSLHKKKKFFIDNYYFHVCFEKSYARTRVFYGKTLIKYMNFGKKVQIKILRAHR